MSLIPFPNVPQVPGVPQLARTPDASDPGFPPSGLLTQDDPGVDSATAAPQWGVFDTDNNPVAVADSFVSFEHTKEWRISNFPVAPNSFGAYNKVETPFEQRVTFAKGGPVADRQSFLDAIDAAVGSLDLYSVVTPDVTYLNANLVRYSYQRRSTNGVTLLLVEISIEQVRVSATLAFSNTKSPASNAAQNGGTVQPQTPTTAQANAAAGGAT